MRLRGAGVALQVALICDVSAGADVLLAPPAIANLAALRGRRIGVESTALGAPVFREQKFAAGSYDAVLMDLQMPVMDGLDATARRARRPVAGPQPAMKRSSCSIV